MGDSPGDSSSAASKLSEIQTQIFAPTCATAGCHVIGIAPHGLILAEGFAYDLLVNAASDENTQMWRVVPGDPENSYLMVKILGDENDPRFIGKRMPRDGPPYLSDVENEMIRSWISAGALDN